MFKKLSILVFSAVLFCFFVFPVSAAEKIYIHDNAGLLQSEDIAELEDAASVLSENYGIDAVILTVDSMNGKSAQNYADEFYDEYSYDDNGVLFLLAMTEREWYISTCGNVIYALTDYGIQQLSEQFLPYLSSGDWYDAFHTFYSILPTYLDAWNAGKPIDGQADYSGDYYHGQQDEIVYSDEDTAPSLLLSLLCGAATGGISILVMRLLMNTKRRQRSASAYLKQGSWKLHTHRDIFLYSNVTKKRRQQNTTSGGSSVHSSSGGRSHGGGGGKF